MLVLTITLVASLLSGTAAWWLVRRWPAGDQQAVQAAARGVADGICHRPGPAARLRSRLGPKPATGLALGAATAVAIAGGVIFGLLLLMVRTKTGFARFDLGAARFGANHATQLSTHVLRLLTQLGGAFVIIPLAIVVAGFAVVETRRQRRVGVVAFLALTVGGQFLAVDLIKWIVGRARPNINQLTGFSGASFPSGHAAASAATFAAFALVLGRRHSGSTRALMAGVAVGLAVAVSGSRVLLGVHWLTDVLAGLAFGWAWFALCTIAFGGRWLRFGAPVEAAEHQLPDGGRQRSRLADEGDRHELRTGGRAGRLR